MLRTIVRLTPTAIIPLFTSRNENDYDTLNRPVTGIPETGWDRVRAMYTKDEYEEISKELHTVVQSSLCGAIIGACFGGFVSSREAYLYFIENNQATIFKSTMEAKVHVIIADESTEQKKGKQRYIIEWYSMYPLYTRRFMPKVIGGAQPIAILKKKLQDYVTIAFAKGAYKWGWKLGTFTGMFSLTATTISVYRGDTSLVEYIAAGAIAGGLYKVNLGLAATFVGAGLGAFLSAIAGTVVIGILKVTGLSMSEIRKALYKLKEAREDQYNQAVEKSATIKNDDLTRHHDHLVEEKGEQKIEHIC